MQLPVITNYSGHTSLNMEFDFEEIWWTEVDSKTSIFSMVYNLVKEDNILIIVWIALRIQI